MLSWGSKKLDEIRNIMPEAGGLVIAPDIEMAKYMAEIIEILEGEKPMLVHSQMPNADNKINILAISTSEIKLSVIIDEENILNAVKKLHTVFDLD